MNILGHIHKLRDTIYFSAVTFLGMSSAAFLSWMIWDVFTGSALGVDKIFPRAVELGMQFAFIVAFVLAIHWVITGFSRAVRK